MARIIALYLKFLSLFFNLFILTTVTYRKIIKTEDGNLTILHSEGAFYCKKNDIAAIEWTNNFYSRFERKTISESIIFWCWVISLSFGLFFSIFGEFALEIPDGKSRGFFSEIMLNILFLIPFLIFFYFTFRLIYYLVYRDMFMKNLLQITLRSNSYISLRSVHGFTGLLKELEMFPIEKKIFNYEWESETNRIKEFKILLLTYTIGFIFIYNTWGDNQITDIRTFISPLEFKDDINEWYKKHENEKIASYYLFTYGYMLPISFVLIILCIIFWLLFIFIQWLIAGLLIYLITVNSIGFITKTKRIKINKLLLKSIDSFLNENENIFSLVASAVAYYFVNIWFFVSIGYNDFVYNAVYKPIHSFFSPVSSALQIGDALSFFQIDGLIFIVIHSLVPYFIVYLIALLFSKIMQKIQNQTRKHKKL